MFSICQVKKIMESEYPNTKFRYIDMNFLPELCKRVSNRLITSKQNSGTFAMGLSFFLHQFRIDNQLIISIPENHNPEDLLDEDIDISGVYCGLMIENDANMVFYEGGMTDQFGFEEICRKILNVEHPFFLIFETKEYIEEIPEILKNITKYSIDTHLYFKIFNEEYNKLLNQNKIVIKEKGYELPINESFNREDIKKYNKLLKNYVLRANKQLENGNKLSDELKNEILDFWKKRNKDYSNLTKMNIIYRCPPSISKKYIKKYKDMNIKYNPQN